MSATIWKYPLDFPNSVVEMPDGAATLHVAVQDGRLCVWAMVSPTAPTRPAYFQTVGTGHPVPDPSVYVGTVHTPPFVWHVFQLPERPASWGMES